MANNDRLNFRINENSKALVEALAVAIDEAPGAVARYMIEKNLFALGVQPGFFDGNSYDHLIERKIAALTVEQLEKIFLEVNEKKETNPT